MKPKVCNKTDKDSNKFWPLKTETYKTMQIYTVFKRQSGFLTIAFVNQYSSLSWGRQNSL